MGFSNQVVQLAATTRTAPDAARAIGCRVEQICKSLVFRAKSSERPLLVIASGVNRMDLAKVSGSASEPVEMADADFVRQHTGYSIGGVPPVGHRTKLETLIDEDLLQHSSIWAAAGHPHAVFELTPAELIQMSGGRVVKLKA
jgi:prolyl-tRNA editing enzyme YbaK/EbsC (Cys-tRNA(Pro) deacylase)